MSAPLTPDRPWPVVAWDHAELIDVAAAVMLQNPNVVIPWPATPDDTASYIRSVAERSLYSYGPNATGAWSMSTGGWLVVFLPTEAPNTFTAHVAVTGYTAHRYAKSRQPQPAAPDTPQPVTLSSTTVRTALIDYRAELIRLAVKFPQHFGTANDATIASIDAALLSIEGNVSTVSLAPCTCKP